MLHGMAVWGRVCNSSRVRCELIVAPVAQVVYNPEDAEVFLPRLLPVLDTASQSVSDPEVRPGALPVTSPRSLLPPPSCSDWRALSSITVRRQPEPKSHHSLIHSTAQDTVYCMLLEDSL